MLRPRRGISPVLGTVILLAVGMIIAMGSAFWLTGMSGQYSNVDVMQIDHVYSVIDSSVNNSRWMIVLSLRNSSPSPCHILYVFVNERPIDEYNITFGGALTNTYSIGTSLPEDGFVMESGESTNAYVWIGSDLFSSGTSVSVRLQNTGGISYISQVKLT